MQWRLITLLEVMTRFVVSSVVMLVAANTRAGRRRWQQYGMGDGAGD